VRGLATVARMLVLLFVLIFYREVDGGEDGVLERAERGFEVTMDRS
jgi:hypothetical protein